jgi:Tol biopolymer transport system component
MEEPVVNRYVKLMNRIALLIGAVVFMHGVSSKIISKPQAALAQTTEDQYVYLPIITRPTGPEYKIVFASDRGLDWNVYDIFTMNMAGENVRNMTNTPDVPESYPVWSPDGTMIAYLSGAEGQEDVFIMNADGSNKRNVSNTPSASEKKPLWSPDSKKVGFLSDRDDQAGVYDVFVVNADGTGLTNLTHSIDADEWSMDWSPDGTKIVYLADKSLHPMSLIGHIVTMNMDGANKQTVFTDTGFNYNPVWTPDGSKITFNFYSGCLAMINADGSNLARCFTAPPELDGMKGFKWNSTGSRLAYVGFFNQNSTRLYIYNPVTKQSTDITPNLLGFSPNMPFDWSADNTQIILGEGGGDGEEISIIKVDGSDYKNLTDSEQGRHRWPDLSPIKLP